MSGRDGRCCCGESGACAPTSPEEKAEIRALSARHADRDEMLAEVTQNAAGMSGDVIGDDLDTWAADMPSIGARTHHTPRRGFIVGALAGLALPFIRPPRVAAGADGMTDEQARTIQAICNGADGECISCAEELRDALIEAFPEHADAFREVHADRYGNWWRDEQ